MDLLTLIFRLPFLPLSGVVRLTEIIAEEAEREYHDPARVRHELEDAQRRRDAGEITDEEMARIEEEAAARMLTPAVPPAAGNDGS